MQIVSRKAHGAFLSLCLMAMLVSAFSWMMIASAALLNTWAAWQMEYGAVPLDPNVRVLTEYFALILFADALILMGVITLGEWKMSGMFSLSIGALLHTAVCTLYGFPLSGLEIRVLMLLLLIALRHKWAFLS